MDLSRAKKEAARVTLLGMWLDIALGLMKIVGGLLTASFALVADGIHSLSDAVSDIFVLVVSHYSHEAPDTEHQYGHGRFEAIGTVVMGMLFFAIASVLIYDCYLRLAGHRVMQVPGPWGILLAAISIAAKEWIYRYTMRTANLLNSSLLQANAWHSRSDAISSIAVLMGLVGAQQGYPWLDLVAAIFVGLIIARIGWRLCLDSLKELVDTAIPADREAQVRSRILGVEGVQEVTGLRSRQAGGKVILEAQVQVDPRITVSEGHQLGEAVASSITGRFADINDVIVHVDPQNPDHLGPQLLPLREEVVARIIDSWKHLVLAAEIKNIDLHYLDDGIEVDAYFEASRLDPATCQDLADALRPLAPIKRLKIYAEMLQNDLR